ncbi:MAG: hypothetical protein ACM34F_15650 [Betaproteobacteria bacterium]
MMRSTLVLVLASSLAGCATYGPVWSEVSGNRYHRAVLNRQPALIEKVDGYSSYAQYPIKLDPGQHEIVLQGASRWPGGAPLRTMALTLEPCKRYYLNAQFEAPGQPRWEPVVDYVEDIAGCPFNGLR